MLKKVQAHIHQNLAFLNGKRLLVAFSAGLDSVVMSDILYQLGFDIGMAHCNFQLRGAASLSDETFAKEWAREKGVPFYRQRFDTVGFAKSNKLSIQEAARALRYEWFDQLRQREKFDHVLTAHHLDDELETFIINLSRGSGILGLSGIPICRGKIVRPLLPFSKEDLRRYAQHQKITWREDASNAEEKYLRNKIRHQIAPELKALHPDFLNQFKQSIEHLSQANTIFKDAIQSLRKQLFTEQEKGIWAIEIKAIQNLHPLSAYLYELFAPYGFTNTLDLSRLLTARSGKRLESEVYTLINSRGFLYLSKTPEKSPKSYLVYQENDKNKNLPIPLKISPITNVQKSLEKVIYLNPDKVKFPLTLRKAKDGDFFYPLGGNGKKKISKFFNDLHFHFFQKQNTWLLCNGEAVIWVVGHRSDKRFTTKISTTDTVLIKIVD